MGALSVGLSVVVVVVVVVVRRRGGANLYTAAPPYRQALSTGEWNTIQIR